MDVSEITKRMVEIQDACLAMTAQCEAEKRDPTNEEKDELQQLTDEFDGLREQVEIQQKLEKQNETLNKSMGRKTEPSEPDEALSMTEDDNDKSKPRRKRGTVYASALANSGKQGWHNLGDFATAVKQASMRGANPGNFDQRLTAATTFGQESVGADGGFAVPPDFINEIMLKVTGEDSLLSRTDQMISSSNSLTVPVDETTPWQTAGGILANWENEGASLTQTKPELKQTTVRLNKLSVLIPVTDELLEDSSALASYLSKKAPDKIDFKINLAIVQGTGSGQPLGILNAPATVSVAKVSGQTADTVVFDNITNMWSRMYAPSRPNAIWLINQDVEPELFNLAFTGTNSPWPAYLPPGGLSSSPFGTLMGKPVILTQACETLGDLGDIILCDLGEYLTAQKAGGIRAETSIHLWFDQDVTAFRFIMRLAGQPWLGSSIAVRDGSNNLSSFITLAERS